MASDALSVNTVVFGMICGIGSGAFTAGTVYGTLLSRLKRNEEKHADLERRFNAEKDRRDANDEAWRSQMRQYDRDIVTLQTEIRHIGETTSAIADKVGAVVR